MDDKPPPKCMMCTGEDAVDFFQLKSGELILTCRKCTEKIMARFKKSALAYLN